MKKHGANLKLYIELASQVIAAIIGACMLRVGLGILPLIIADILIGSIGNAYEFFLAPTGKSLSGIHWIEEIILTIILDLFAADLIAFSVGTSIVLLRHFHKNSLSDILVRIFCYDSPISFLSYSSAQPQQ